MKMVGHQTISEQPHRHSLAGFAEEFNEGSKVAILAKDGTPPIATINDVVTIAAQSISCTARHNHDYDIGTRCRQDKAPCPLFYLLCPGSFAPVFIPFRPP